MHPCHKQAAQTVPKKSNKMIKKKTNKKAKLVEIIFLVSNC
jgi:hypothetical protein